MQPVPALPVPILLASALGLAVWSGGAQAQQASPSFNCRYASTETEIAICDSPALAELEMQMYGDYLALVDRVGEREARRIADELLERRQACGADRSCIAQRLLITMEVFRQRAQPEQELAAVEPPPEPVPEPAPEAAPAPEEPEIPLAALEAWPPELEPAPAEEVEAAEPPEEAAPDPVAPEPLALDDAADPVAIGPTVELDGDLAAFEPAPEEGPEEGIADPVVVESAPEEAPAELAALEPPPEEPAVTDPVAKEPPPAEDTTELAAAEPPLVEAPPPAEPPAAEPPPAEPLPAEPPSEAALDEAISGAELTSSTPEPAPFDTPLSWAFMDLSRADRAALQARLQEAGYYQGPGNGIWDQATVEALNAFLASPEGQGFDPGSLSGAALVLDYLGSDAFARTAAADPLDAAEW